MTLDLDDARYFSTTFASCVDSGERLKAKFVFHLP